MSRMAELVPSGPDWTVDWAAIDAAFPEVAAMRGTPHDPVHHGEGDPWVHTHMVCLEMASSERWRALPPPARSSAFAAAVFHDVGKPATAETTAEGRVTHRGHSSLGSVMARGALWRDGYDPRLREAACSAIGLHQVPFWLLERQWHEIRRIVVGASLTCGNAVLRELAAADARGRRAPDMVRMADAVELFGLAAEEHGCLDAPFPVADGTTLAAFMASPETVDPGYAVGRAAGRPTATLMSGLPGSGKSTWISREAAELPVVSLDAIRERLGVPPEKPQGPVAMAAKEEARGHLRARRSFVWDGTNVTRDLRGPILGLFADYGFSTRVVALEATPAETLARFRARGRTVPAGAMASLVRRWRHPDPWDAESCEGPGFGAPPGAARHEAAPPSP